MTGPRADVSATHNERRWHCSIPDISGTGEVCDDAWRGNAALAAGALDIKTKELMNGGPNLRGCVMLVAATRSLARPSWTDRVIAQGRCVANGLRA